MHCNAIALKQYYIKIEGGDGNLTLSSAMVITLAESTKPHYFVCIGETALFMDAYCKPGKKG